jgi:hypothetical protein
MIQVGSIVKCIKGKEGGVLNEGQEYTVLQITQKGNFIIEEDESPFEYGCFDHTRFEDTGKTVYTEMREYFSEYELEDYFGE